MEAMRGKDGAGTSTGGSAEMVARDTERWREAAPGSAGSKASDTR